MQTVSLYTNDILEHIVLKYEKRVKWFREYKSTLSCVRCGGKDKLEFHHKDPSKKKYKISKIISSGLSWEKVLAEIDKCEPLCYKCHKDFHKYPGFVVVIVPVYISVNNQEVDFLKQKVLQNQRDIYPIVQ